MARISFESSGVEGGFGVGLGVSGGFVEVLWVGGGVVEEGWGLQRRVGGCCGGASGRSLVESGGELGVRGARPPPF